jgi:SMI1 / KNR4 family (SUKH-1)
MIAQHLKSISTNAIELNPELYSDKEKLKQWIGKPPANDNEIAATEKRLGIALPKDVIEFYKITNGTSEILSHTFSEFMTISQIDWLKNLQPETIDAYSGMGEAYVADLTNSILIAGLNHAHQILIIQPCDENTTWKYWEFASYLPGESAFNGIEKYLDRIDNFLKDQVKNKAETFPTIDYSIIIDALQKQDWMTVYSNATGTILRYLEFPKYEPNTNLYGLCLIATSHLGNQSHFKTVLESIPRISKNETLHNNLLIQDYIIAAENKMAYLREWQDYIKFKPQQNPKSLEDIELQIKEHRKDLLKPEELISKRDYQLHFLYEYGNAAGFVKLYGDSIIPFNFLRSARVFAYVGNNEKAMECINQYMADVIYDERIFEVYMDEALIKVLEKQN